jgi:hypothetical protein
MENKGTRRAFVGVTYCQRPPDQPGCGSYATAATIAIDRGHFSLGPGRQL